MPDIMPAKIKIGGAITKKQAEEIVRICTEESDDDSFVYYVDEQGRAREVKNLEEAVNRDIRWGQSSYNVCVLINDEATWGEFGLLEEYLVEQRIPFQRTTEGYDLECRVTFDPAQGLEEPYHERIINGQVHIGRDEVLRAYLQLLENNEHAASFTLQRALGKTVELLPTFRIADK